jgi:3-isopropylmalate/(R)-2-methylmalate dehydratase small subunit
MASGSGTVVEPDELPYLHGRAWKFGDRVSCEQILPARHRAHDFGVGRFAMSGLDPEFSSQARPGDFLAAGVEFGRGEGIGAAVRALRRFGIGAVICRSFAGDFAATDLGLPALQVEETAAIKTGDRLRVDVEGHKVVNLSSGDRYVIRNLHGEALETLRRRRMADAAD